MKIKNIGIEGVKVGDEAIGVGLYGKVEFVGKVSGIADSKVELTREIVDSFWFINWRRTRIEWFDKSYGRKLNR